MSIFPTAQAEKTATVPAAPAGPAAAAACDRAPRVTALPRPTDSYTGPYPKLAPPRSRTRLEQRLNALLPTVSKEVHAGLQARCGWTKSLDRVQVEIVDRAGMRATLRNQEGYGVVMAFCLAWAMPISYAPGLGRVLVVGPTAKSYSDSTLRFQLARALCAGAVAQEHRSFYDHVARRLISARPRAYDIYACRAWANALGESVATCVDKKGRKGPWWQRLALLCLWPFASYTVGPQRLGRRFVPILEQVAASDGPQLVDRMFRFPPLCSVLYGKPGRRLLVVSHTPDYQRADLRRDVAQLRQYNPQAGATSFSVET